MDYANYIPNLFKKDDPPINNKPPEIQSPMSTLSSFKERRKSTSSLPSCTVSFILSASDTLPKNDTKITNKNTDSIIVHKAQEPNSPMSTLLLLSNTSLPPTLKEQRRKSAPSVPSCTVSGTSSETNTITIKEANCIKLSHKNDKNVYHNDKPFIKRRNSTQMVIKKNKNIFDTQSDISIHTIDETTKIKVSCNNCYLWRKKGQKQQSKIEKLQVELNDIKGKNNELKMNLKMEQETYVCEKNKFIRQLNALKSKNNELEVENNELKEENEYQLGKINGLKIENGAIKADVIALQLKMKNEKKKKLMEKRKSELLNINMGLAKDKLAKYSQLLIWGLPLLTDKI
eukprot:95881_1